MIPYDEYMTDMKRACGEEFDIAPDIEYLLREWQPFYEKNGGQLSADDLIEGAYADLQLWIIGDWESCIVRPPFVERTPENIAQAEFFVFKKWRERAKYLNLPAPDDMADGGEFASLFAQLIFGGERRGNSDHQWVEFADGGRVDLARSKDPRYEHDDEFWMNPEHRESLSHCKERVRGWVAEFRTKLRRVGDVVWSYDNVKFPVTRECVVKEITRYGRYCIVEFKEGHRGERDILRGIMTNDEYVKWSATRNMEAMEPLVNFVEAIRAKK